MARESRKWSGLPLPVYWENGGGGGFGGSGGGGGGAGGGCGGGGGGSGVGVGVGDGGGSANDPVEMRRNIVATQQSVRSCVATHESHGRDSNRREYM